MFKKFKSLILSCSMVATLGFVSSCGSNSGSNIQIAGLKGPDVTLLNDSMLISIVFQNIQMDGGLRYNIPKYTNSYLEISPDASSGGTLMSVSVSLADLMNTGLQKLDPQKLPGGRNLPGVAGGSLPAVAFSIEKFHNMSFYLGPNIFAIFLPAETGVDGSIATFNYYVSGKTAGTLSLVGKDTNGENSGVLLMLKVTPQQQNAFLQSQRKDSASY